MLLKTKLRTAVFALSVAFATSSCDARSSNDLQVEVLDHGVRGPCNVNRLLPSSDGERLAVFRATTNFVDAISHGIPEGFVVYTSIENGKTTGGKLHPDSVTFSAGANHLEPIGWADSELIFRAGSNFFGRAKHRDDWTVSLNEVSNELRSFQIQSSQSIDPEILNDGDLLREAGILAKREDLRRRTIYLGSSIYFSALDLDDAQSLLFGQTAQALNPLGPASFFHQFHVATNGESYAPYYLGREMVPGENSYSQVIIDYKNGMAVGQFRPDRLNGAWQLDRLLEVGGYLILDVVRAGNRNFVLAKNDDGIDAFIQNASKPAQIGQFEVCQNGRSAARYAETQTKEAETEVVTLPRPQYGVSFDGDGQTTGVFFRGLNSDRDKLIVYYHGGPAGTMYGRGLGYELNELRRVGFDVLAVEYSGSIGGGLQLSRGLAEKPMFGFQEDALAVKNWIETKGYRTVGVYAQSFGAIPALIFVHENKAAINRTVFLAPLLALPNTDVTDAAGGRFFGVEEGASVQFQTSLFGSIERRNEFGARAADYSTNFSASEHDLFIFGALDTKTPLTSAPKVILDNARIIEVPKTTHEFLGSRETTRSIIVDHFTSP